MKNFNCTVNKLNPERYFENKEYFDEGLIACLKKQNEKVKKLEDQVFLKDIRIRKQQAVIKAQNIKIKDLKAVVKTMKTSGSDQKETIRDIQRQLEELQKELDQKLIDAYRENNELHYENQKLKDEIKKYKKSENSRNKKSSKNSSIPPSQDEFNRIKANENRRKRNPSTKLKGGQKGHAVHRSKQTNKPDKIEVKFVKEAPKGAEKRVDSEGKTYYAVQQTDASFKVKVTEFRYYISADGEELSADIMNKYKINSCSYSDHMRAMTLYLNSKGVLALDRLCIMLNEMSEGKLNLSPGSVVNWSTEFGKKAEPKKQEILKCIKSAAVSNVDETGYRENGKQAWVHTIINDKGVWFVMTKKRKDTKTGPLSVLADYTGNLCHDHYKPYYALEKSTHAECNAHITRYLEAGVDFNESAACGEMIRLLESANQRKHKLIKAGQYYMDGEEFEKISRHYDQIINDELASYSTENPNMPAKYVPEYIKTLRRMKEFKTEHLRFLTDFRIPFSNNIAERAARQVKQHKKIKGQCSSIERGNDLMATLTIIGTARIRKKNVLHSIEDILSSPYPHL